MDSYLQVLNIMSLQAVNSYIKTNLCRFLHCPWSCMGLLKMNVFRKCLVQILAITLHDMFLQFSSDPPCKYHGSRIRLWQSPFHFTIHQPPYHSMIYSPRYWQQGKIATNPHIHTRHTRTTKKAQKFKYTQTFLSFICNPPIMITHKSESNM